MLSSLPARPTGLQIPALLVVSLVSLGCRGERVSPVSSTKVVSKTPTPPKPAPPTLYEIICRAFDRHRVKARHRPIYLALAHLESNFTVDEISPVGAVGLFQITPVTAASILAAHPDLSPDLPLYNPPLDNGRHILYRGTAERYSLKVMRWYATRLGRERDRLRGGEDYPRAIRALDIRFDPHANASMGVFHLERLRKGYFGHRRCYRYRGRLDKHKGKKLCGTFSGRHATLLAAAGYHLGIGAVESMLAVSQSRSIRQYVTSIRRSRDPMYRRNHYYIAKLQRLSRRYSALLSSELDRAAMARAFRRQPALARRLFRRFPAPPDRPASSRSASVR
jgi:hypothetical protein